MKFILGIGNPGSKYTNTRHNIGFQVLDGFAASQNLKFIPSKSDFWFVESKLNTFPFFLIKPSTYVNNTGLILPDLINKFGLKNENLLVIYDDINLETGKIRIRKTGSDGGHNGIKSIIYNLRTENFLRIRIGISQPKENINIADYVLSEFTKDEKLLIKNKFPLIFKLIEQFIIGNQNKMLNYFSIASQKNKPNEIP